MGGGGGEELNGCNRMSPSPRGVGVGGRRWQKLFVVINLSLSLPPSLCLSLAHSHTHSPHTCTQAHVQSTCYMRIYTTEEKEWEKKTTNTSKDYIIFLS